MGFSTLWALPISVTFCIASALADLTVYTTATNADGSVPTPCIGAVPCDGNVLQPIGTQQNWNASIPVQLYSGGMDGLSIPIAGHFAGFSIELSVIDKLIGDNGDYLNPIFLNLMSTLTTRVGALYIRVGGNTQDLATVLTSSMKKAIVKADGDDDSTFTPRLNVSPEILYAMNNISALLPIKWFVGVPFNDTTNPRLLMGELSQSILGDNLLGLQLGNEPDLYSNNGIRSSGYSQAQYNTEFGEVLQDYIDDSSTTNKSMFIAPSVCCGDGIGWTPESIWNTGFLDNYGDHLSYLSVQHYPTDNCNSSGTAIDPQQLLYSMVLNHNNVQTLNTAYVNSTSIAQSLGKPFVMFETNSASCGGFSGLSDAFAASMWTVDYSLNQAMTNFSHSLQHVGGQSDYYNAFTPMSTNQSSFHQWTIGSTFYSMLALTEIFGTSGTARVVDLYLNSNSALTPGYVIYENENPARVVLMNYVTDSSGAMNYTAYVSVGGNSTGQGNATPESVQVKYMLAASATDKFGITWAGQTFGGAFASDGRLTGDEVIYTYSCDTTNNVCAIPVPAPAIAVVFLNSDAFKESEPTATNTFATTVAATIAANTATVAQAVLQTSNGRGGGKWDFLGSTSYGSTSDGGLGTRAIAASALLTLGFACVGSLLIPRTLY